MARRSDPDEPIVIATAPTEVQGEELASVIRARGIDAMTLGGMTAGFRAEAPGYVKVMVRRADAPAAADALRTAGADAASINWNDVNLGQGDAAPPDNAPADPDRQWAWTLSLVVLIPLGLAFTLFNAGRSASDPATRLIGPIILCVGIVLVIWLTTTRRNASTSDHADEP